MKIRSEFYIRMIAGGAASLMSYSVSAGAPVLSGLAAQADNAQSAFFAPAAMSRLEGNHTTVQGMVAYSFSRFVIDESKTTVDGGDADHDGEPLIIPFIYHVRQLNENWHAGLSFTSPGGLGSTYGNTWAGRYRTVEYSLAYLALTPSISYRVTDKLSLGGAIGINFTQESSEVKIRQAFQEGDGKLKSELDGIGINVTLSAFYEFSQRTRASITWTSDSDADLEGNLRLRNLDPVFDEIATDLGLKNVNVEVTNTLPQRVLGGIYHEFESGNYITLDGVWMQFSSFSTSDIKLDGNDVNLSSPKIYDDIWATTIGMGFPVDDRTTYRVGAVYVSPGVDDDDRTFSIRIDRMWGIGAGVNYKLGNQRSLDFNLNVLDLGEAPVDTGGIFETEFGRVAGKSEDPYAVMVELTYHL